MLRAGTRLPGSHERSRSMVRIWQSAEVIHAAAGQHRLESRNLPDEMRGTVDSASVERHELADGFRLAAGAGSYPSAG